MRVALVQVASPSSESVPARRERVRRMLDDAAGSDLIVLPELWAPGYFSFDAYPDLAEPMNGDTLSAAREWAQELQCHLHLGSFLERTADGRLHNTAVLIGPDGTVLHEYRKIHVFGYKSREQELLSPGTAVSTADTEFGPVAATTCYDLRFPELWRLLVDGGAETVITPAAWPAARREHWRLFTSCRAVEQQVLLIACNAVGTQGDGVELGGFSRVVDPWGEVLIEAGSEESVTTVDVAPEIVGEVRREFPVLADRTIQISALPSPRTQTGVPT